MASTTSSRAVITGFPELPSYSYVCTYLEVPPHSFSHALGNIPRKEKFLTFSSKHVFSLKAKKSLCVFLMHQELAQKPRSITEAGRMLY